MSLWYLCSFGIRYSALVKALWRVCFFGIYKDALVMLLWWLRCFNFHKGALVNSQTVEKANIQIYINSKRWIMIHRHALLKNRIINYLNIDDSILVSL